MPTKTANRLLADASAWWDTSIIDIHPGKIAIRGYPIEELIGHVRFPDMIWLMLRGELPSRGQADLLEAAMVPGVDHGPHAPSIAIARMAVTCGLPVNGAMASAINVLDDIHGGAASSAWSSIARSTPRPAPTATWSRRRGPSSSAAWTPARRSCPASATASTRSTRGPRRCSRWSRRRRPRAWCRGRWAAIGHAVEAALAAIKNRHIPMNIDGITAVIFCELGFEPELGRGLFILSRSVGILAHAWEQKQRGRRIMGPMPREIPYHYSGRRGAPCPPPPTATPRSKRR